MVSYRIVSVHHVNTQYRIESPLPGIAHLYFLERHVGVLVDVIHLALPQVKKVTSIRTICDAMKCDPYRSMLSEVHKLLRLYLTIPITSSTSERAFSTFTSIKT